MKIDSLFRLKELAIQLDVRRFIVDQDSFNKIWDRTTPDCKKSDGEFRFDFLLPDGSTQ